MASTGLVYPTTVATVPGTGGGAGGEFTNPQNAAGVPDLLFANQTAITLSFTDVMRASPAGLGITSGVGAGKIPTNAKITGVSIALRTWVNQSGGGLFNTWEYAAQLLNGTTPIGVRRSVFHPGFTPEFLLANGFGVVTIGGPNDLFGLAPGFLTPAYVIANLAFQFQAQSPLAVEDEMQIESMGVQVFYTTSGKLRNQRVASIF